MSGELFRLVRELAKVGAVVSFREQQVGDRPELHVEVRRGEGLELSDLVRGEADAIATLARFVEEAT